MALAVPALSLRRVGCRMLSRDGVAKIGDVGLARVLTREGARVSQEGTFEWAAPEVGVSQTFVDVHRRVHGPHWMDSPISCLS